jgi:flagellar basal-body rod protein FlgC
MGLFDSNSISATALTAQRLRMDVISQNIANANTTRTAEGGPYKRKTVLFQEILENDPYNVKLDGVNGAALQASRGKGVRVTQIIEDETPGTLTYDPSHPDADEEGYVRMPNINIVEEMVNMISASRSYEANVTAMTSTKAMVAKTLELGR